MSDITLKVAADGSIEGIGHANAFAAAGLAELGFTHVRRASHVEPVGKWRRRWFHCLRWVFGERGQVAAWTRRWDCRWLVNLLPVGGPYLGPYDQRADAIAAEVAWLERFWLEREVA